MSVLRGRTASGKLPRRRAELALRDLHDLPLQPVSHQLLLPRCWELRADLTVYDAACVALAELLDVPLVTVGARLGRAPGIRCTVEAVAD